MVRGGLSPRLPSFLSLGARLERNICLTATFASGFVLRAQSKKVVRVHFVDKSCKAIAIDNNTTAADLRETVIERIELKEEACFYLFEKRDDWGAYFLSLSPLFQRLARCSFSYSNPSVCVCFSPVAPRVCFIFIFLPHLTERCLEPDDKPAEIMLQWEKLEKKKAEECIFLFKKKIFLKDDDREMEDLVAKDLIYKQVRLSLPRLFHTNERCDLPLVVIQALASVISSEYPCTVEDAIKLAGLQFQIVYGDHNPQFHVPKFLLYVLPQATTAIAATRAPRRC